VIQKKPAENTAELSQPIKPRNIGRMHGTFLSWIELQSCKKAWHMLKKLVPVSGTRFLSPYNIPNKAIQISSFSFVKFILFSL